MIKKKLCNHSFTSLCQHLCQKESITRFHPQTQIFFLAIIKILLSYNHLSIFHIINVNSSLIILYLFSTSLLLFIFFISFCLSINTETLLSSIIFFYVAVNHISIFCFYVTTKSFIINRYLFL